MSRESNTFYQAKGERIRYCGSGEVVIYIRAGDVAHAREIYNSIKDMKSYESVRKKKTKTRRLQEVRFVLDIRKLNKSDLENLREDGLDLEDIFAQRRDNYFIPHVPRA